MRLSAVVAWTYGAAIFHDGCQPADPREEDFLSPIGPDESIGWTPTCDGCGREIWSLSHDEPPPWAEDLDPEDEPAAATAGPGHYTKE